MKKYPNEGLFRPKPCRACDTKFTPTAPSNLYCNDECAARGYRNAYLKRTYGLTADQYDKMAEERDHCCDICGGEGFVMDNQRHHVKLCVDHCHDTGAVRGLLCHNCNRALGLLADSTERLSMAVRYLERATTIPKGSTPKRVEAVGTQ